MDNIEAIARGKGSSQARDEGCQRCREEEESPEYETTGKCIICSGELGEYVQYGVYVVCPRCREEGENE